MADTAHTTNCIQGRGCHYFKLGVSMLVCRASCNTWYKLWTSLVQTAADINLASWMLLVQFEARTRGKAWVGASKLKVKIQMCCSGRWPLIDPCYNLRNYKLLKKYLLQNMWIADSIPWYETIPPSHLHVWRKEQRQQWNTLNWKGILI